MNKKLFGFTLAEVLITLAIIGVVAALTIPTLVTNHKERVTVTKVKQFYGIFSQAYRMATNEYGPVDTWGLKDQEAGDLTDDEGNIIDRVPSAESIIHADKFLKRIEQFITHTNSQKNKRTGFVNERSMANGVTITTVALNPSSCTRSEKYDCGQIYIRTEGSENNEKKSKYVFAFYFYKDGSVVPFGTQAQRTFEVRCLPRENNSHCTAWVLENENMDYLKCDDLSWDGKRSCSGK